MSSMVKTAQNCARPRSGLAGLFFKYKIIKKKGKKKKKKSAEYKKSKNRFFLKRIIIFKTVSDFKKK